MSNRKPNKRNLFVVAGMPRTGTTFLYHYLSKHPDIFLPFRKEVNYFNINYSKGRDWYDKLYRECPDEMIRGDISPPCFLDDKSISRIKNYDPNVKIILIVRDPAEWAVSFYKQFNTFNIKMPSLSEYVKNGYIYRMGNKELKVSTEGRWISNRINDYINEFGNNLLIYDFSYFKKNPLATLSIIEEFLGIGKHFNEENFDNVRINESNRRNVKIISWLLSRESFVEFIGNVFPRSLIVYLRGIFDKYSSRSSGENSMKATHDISDIEFVREHLEDETIAINNIFKDGKVLIGGVPYRPARTE